MSTLAQRQQAFIDDFNSLDAWSDKFNYLVDLSNELPAFDSSLRTPANRITGCISSTYFNAAYASGVVQIQGYSNATTMAGIIQAIREIFNGSTPEELAEVTINFHTSTKLINNMTVTRAAVLQNIINRIINL